MVNFKDKSMPTAIEKALDFIGGMNTSASVPHSMDESTAKGILKYFHDLGVPASPEVVMARGEQEGWNPEFTKKVAGWAEKVASGNRILIKNPEYFSTYMQEQLKELV
ncbi:DUF1889 family protein [Salmonella enterica subsp. enterica serovar Kentucky]|nr:DUF1889 family protein [Salmonella enterica]EBK2220934.1 DUF1889 family protein [Salmonella enterica subsp. enterica serovar Dublin]EGP7865930.1 DUF1889 family protein [Salmonella enterica subsp. enterica serovar Infantis]ECY4225239.1 DUF1889 family protein [Salmonella enterica subsp. enterica serovar Dublin]EHI8393661.1 DUF1889 family protein [Salmonella enterica]